MKNIITERNKRKKVWNDYSMDDRYLITYGMGVYVSGVKVSRALEERIRQDFVNGGYLTKNYFDELLVALSKGRDLILEKRAY